MFLAFSRRRPILSTSDDPAADPGRGSRWVLIRILLLPILLRILLRILLSSCCGSCVIHAIPALCWTTGDGLIPPGSHCDTIPPRYQRDTHRNTRRDTRDTYGYPGIPPGTPEYHGIPTTRDVHGRDAPGKAPSRFMQSAASPCAESWHWGVTSNMNCLFYVRLPLVD
jgi:hypothetical protein